MTLYTIVYKDWHKEYRLAKNKKDSFSVGAMIYSKSPVWYTVEM